MSESPNSERLALSPAEAAKAVGVSERTIRKNLHKLPHARIGNRIVIPVDSLKEWLREQARNEQQQNDGVHGMINEIVESFE